MAKPRRTPEERLDELKRKKDQIAAQIQKEQAKLRDAARKEDTRRKIVAGAIALEHAEHNENFGQYLHDILDRYVTRPEDRKLFELDPLPENDSEPAPVQGHAARTFNRK